MVGFAGGNGPGATAAGDFNGDGKPDLAITNKYGVEVMMNTTPKP
jgi:hypothetical protein